MKLLKYKCRDLSLSLIGLSHGKSPIFIAAESAPLICVRIVQLHMVGWTVEAVSDIACIDCLTEETVVECWLVVESVDDGRLRYSIFGIQIIAKISW